MSGLSSMITSGNGAGLIWIMIIIPVILAFLTLIIPKTAYIGRAIALLVGVIFNFIAAIAVFSTQEITMLLPWANFEMNLAFRIYNFSGFIVLAISVFALLIAIYSVAFMRNKNESGQVFFFYLLTVALANGAVLANNFVIMLFFWEALLVTLFGFLIINQKKNVKTAVKALVLSGTADLLLMLGIALTVYQAGTLSMDAIVDLPISGIGVAGYICLMLGAIGKAGSMPFHSWIPDAANDAPLPFMPLLPGSMEKLLGIYLLVRVSYNFYNLQPETGVSIAVMTIGAVTIILAVAMALIQKDMKRLLAYHAISQVGYMILGIGTALPVGLIGGLYHMINNALYKSCLFLTAGSIEHRTGTTDLRKIGGLAKVMPVTAVCFIIAALSIAGVPPFNGFFSKELIFDAALESGWIFYAAALLGAFMTAASFLKMGHAAFFGKENAPADAVKKESPPAMQLPMIILAAGCIIFGVCNFIPVKLIFQPMFADIVGSHNFAGWPHSATLVLISCIVLLIAVLNHIYGVKKTGQGLGAVDHIHYAPVLHSIYNGAEKRYFDPYEWLMIVVKIYAYISFGIDRAINWIYDVLLVKIVSFVSARLRMANNGSPARYMVWSFSGVAFIVVLFIALM